MAHHHEEEHCEHCHEHHTHTHDEHIHVHEEPAAHGTHTHGEHIHGTHTHGEHAHGEHTHGTHTHGDHAHAHAGHSHHHEEGGVKETLIKIIVASVLLAIAVVIERVTELPQWAYLLIYLVPYLVAGGETLKEAAEGLAHGEALSEDFLMSVATLGALGIGFMPGAESQFPEAVFVMLFFQVGELFESIAEGRSRRSIAHLMDIRPDIAHLENGVDVHPSKVLPGDVIVIRPGEKVPLDGVVLEGTSTLDTVALTGESVPRGTGPGDEILSGCVNLSGVLRVKATKAFGESTASKILELVEHAAEKKSRSENFITTFAKVYTPIVVGLAVLLALVPGLITGAWSTWIYRALLFLVVSCPCALVISVPLSFFGGIGGASRKGILIKGSNLFDKLGKLQTVVFDKTGTLTRGVFQVTAVHPDIESETELLHLAAHVERHSTHPIAMALRNAYPDEADDCTITDIHETAGHGVTALVNGRRVAVGGERLMEAEGASWRPCHHSGTIVHVSIDGQYAGHIVISDELKPDSVDVVAALKTLGVSRTVMLTGDQKSVAADVAAKVGVDEYHAGLLPADKVSRVEQLLDSDAGKSRPLAFVGDGINDAPVLALSDIGIAMGALGSDAAIEAADVVLMDDKPSRLADAIRIARRTVRIATENIWFAVGIKVLVLVLASLGLATMWMAVFADVGVTVLAVLNAMRSAA